MKDDRGNRRDQDRSDRINDVDRPDNSPSREMQSKALDMGNHDETMYDAYGGPAAPPFTSDMPPPPVLMPVPGAGLVSLPIILPCLSLIHFIEIQLVLI